MQNKRSKGVVSHFENKTDTVIPGGSICAIGASGKEYIGVAVKDIQPNAVEIVEIEGIFTFTKAAGEILQGAALYIADEASGKDVATTGSIYVGRCEASVASAETEVDVRINFMPIAAASA